MNGASGAHSWSTFTKQHAVSALTPASLWLSSCTLASSPATFFKDAFSIRSWSCFFSSSLSVPSLLSNSLTAIGLLAGQFRVSLKRKRVDPSCGCDIFERNPRLRAVGPGAVADHS